MPKVPSGARTGSLGLIEQHVANLSSEWAGGQSPNTQPQPHSVPPQAPLQGSLSSLPLKATSGVTRSRLMTFLSRKKVHLTVRAPRTVHWMSRCTLLWSQAGLGPLVGQHWCLQALVSKAGLSLHRAIWGGRSTGLGGRCWGRGHRPPCQLTWVWVLTKRWLSQADVWLSPYILGYHGSGSWFHLVLFFFINLNNFEGGQTEEIKAYNFFLVT